MLAFFAEDLVRVWTGDSEIAATVAPMIAFLAIGSALNGVMYFRYAPTGVWDGLDPVNHKYYADVFPDTDDRLSGAGIWRAGRSDGLDDRGSGVCAAGALADTSLYPERIGAEMVPAGCMSAAYVDAADGVAGHRAILACDTHYERVMWAGGLAIFTATLILLMSGQLRNLVWSCARVKRFSTRM